MVVARGLKVNQKNPIYSSCIEKLEFQKFRIKILKVRIYNKFSKVLRDFVEANEKEKEDPLNREKLKERMILILKERDNLVQRKNKHVIYPNFENQA